MPDGTPADSEPAKGAGTQQSGLALALWSASILVVVVLVAVGLVSRQGRRLDPHRPLDRHTPGFPGRTVARRLHLHPLPGDLSTDDRPDEPGRRIPR